MLVISREINFKDLEKFNILKVDLIKVNSIGGKYMEKEYISMKVVIGIKEISIEI
jgi:hypothetical protein